MSTILTASGLNFDVANPNADLIDIEDIAHSLAHLCRFTGHTDRFYSVAEHSVRAAWHVAPEHQLEALLHDATEAYLGDVASPLKALLPEYRAIEARLEACIRQHFGLPATPSLAIKAADLAMLATERFHLMPANFDSWPQLAGVTPAAPIFDTWTPSQARHQFLTAYKRLTQITVLEAA